MECFECGSVESLHSHHVVPRSRGGTKTVPLCYGCHARAHGRSGNFDTGALTVEALAHKKAKGEFCGGHAPYGYRVGDDGVTLVEDGYEQGIIDAIATYRKAGMSIRRIVDALAADGTIGRAGKPLQRSSIAKLVRTVGVSP